MARLTSEERVAKEILVEEEIDHDQECRRRNGIVNNYTPIEQIPDRNPDWYRYTDKGNLLHFAMPV